jgi:hypothetical protein
MDYISQKIGFRVDETRKTFCVIIRKDGGWLEFGEKQSYPYLPEGVPSSAEYASELALLMLEAQRPLVAKKFRRAVFPR